MKYDVKDMKLAKKGALRIEWARNNMPVLGLVAERFKRERPLKGLTIAACLHVTTETAVLMEVLKAGGADVALCASNPLSTQDDVAASLVSHLKIPVFAIKGEDTKTYYRHLVSSLECQPNITMDDGADTVSLIHQHPEKYFKKPIIGGTEETTTGVIRLRALASEGKLKYPIIAVNDALTKHMFDNRYGTGQSTIDGIVRATNKLIAGSNFVVCGYGWCGRGVAMRAQGMGANVIVIEVNPLRGLEAVMDGYRVMTIKEAAKIGDIFCTVTGDLNVIREEHFAVMQNGAIVCNSGHFNAEIEIPGLEKLMKSKKTIRDYVEEYILRNGRKIYLLGEGRLINLAAAEGHPAAVMDMSFCNQALGVEYMKDHYKELDKNVYKVPDPIDNEIARLKLKSMGVTIDKLTPEQEKYLSSWEMGT
jgi:adenosylhomocysteinase